MRISDWSSDVCSSDLGLSRPIRASAVDRGRRCLSPSTSRSCRPDRPDRRPRAAADGPAHCRSQQVPSGQPGDCRSQPAVLRSAETTSELPTLMRISYALFSLKKKKEYVNSEKPKE